MKWLEAVIPRVAAPESCLPALDSIRNAIASIDAEELRVAFYNSRGERASLSETISTVISKHLSASGGKWSKGVNHPIPHLPQSSDMSWNGCALRFGFHNKAAVLRNLLAPSLETRLANSGAQRCQSWDATVVVSATLSFRKNAGMDGSVGTFEDYEATLAACNTWIQGYALVIGLSAIDNLRVIHEKNYKGKKRALVETVDD